MSDVINNPFPDDFLPTPEQNLAGLRANGTTWDAAIRAHPLYKASPADGSGDAALAEALNAITEGGGTRPVSVNKITNYLRAENKWLGIKKAAAAGDVAAEAAVDLSEDTRDNTVRLDLLLVKQLLGSLVQSDLMTADNLAAINEMGKIIVPWWQTIGAPSPLNEHDIARARAGG